MRPETYSIEHELGVVDLSVEAIVNSVRRMRFGPLRRSRPDWWCNSAEQAASERALDSAVVSERFAVVIANHR